MALSKDVNLSFIIQDEPNHDSEEQIREAAHESPNRFNTNSNCNVFICCWDIEVEEWNDRVRQNHKNVADRDELVDLKLLLYFSGAVLNLRRYFSDQSKYKRQQTTWNQIAYNCQIP